MKQLFIIITILLALVTTGCIEDGVSTDASDQPSFSTDTLSFGNVLTAETTPTSRFIVYNRHDKIISVNNISLDEDYRHVFRINVDGISGSEFENVEIRPNDSIFVFAEAVLPENGGDLPVEINTKLNFTTLGRTQSVVLHAVGQDVTRLRGETVTTDTRFTASKPYQIFDSLVVAEGVTLTLEPGTRLLFHDKTAALIVRGTLKSLGEPGSNVSMTGDRSGGYVAAKIPYEVMSGQWQGVYFAPSSVDNELRFTSVRNTVTGVTFDHVAGRQMIIGSQLRNSQGYALEASMTDLFVAATELADASSGVVRLEGGNHVINHCTIANYYLFTALGGPALQFSHLNADTDNDSGAPYLKAEITNSIIYGNGKDLSHGDLTETDVVFHRVLFKSAGSDDENFVDCLWEGDPCYFTVREKYIFDYRLRPESDAIGSGLSGLMLPESEIDRYGVRRDKSSPDLGAYCFTATEQ